MIVRDAHPGEPDGHLCIPQADHAAVAGQLARAWGNQSFPPPRPRADVCLAATRHDDGMAPYDAAPALDPERGLPVGFMRMALEPWLECWRRGPAAVAADSAYAGLLVSLHAEYLLGFRSLAESDDEGRATVAAYRAEQQRLRSELLEGLRAEGFAAVDLSPGRIERNRRLLEVWDAMSLAVCMPRLPESFADVPAEPSPLRLEMREIGPSDPPTGMVVEVDPWPFSGAEVLLTATGRRLRGTFQDRESLRAALAAAEPEQLAVALVPRVR